MADGPSDCPDGYYYSTTFGKCLKGDSGDVGQDPNDGGDGGDGGGSYSWDDIAPGWLRANTDFLRTFARNPRLTILGALLGALLTGVQNIWEVVLGALQTVWYGEYIGSTAGQIGIADLPVILAERLISAGDPLGETIIGLIESMNTGMESLLVGLGPFAFPVVVAVIVGVLLITERAVTRIPVAVLDSIPVIGPFVKNLVFGP